MIECCADAYLSESWCREDSDQVGSVLSITGYIIKSSNFPIVWVSKIQTEIALLTTEDAYISLSRIIMDLIPLSRLW